LANIKLGKGKSVQTDEERYEELIRKNPDDDRAYLRLAEIYGRSGQDVKAIEIYEKLAALFEKKGFLNKAKAVLKQALMINPEHGKINVLLADYDKQSGLIKDAALRYNVAVNFYQKNGNNVAAISILKKICDLYPKNFSIKVKLANMLISEGMNAEAVKILVPIAESLKDSDKVNEYASVLKLLYSASTNGSSFGRELAELYIRRGSYHNALIILQKLIVDHQEDIGLMTQLAFVFEKTNDYQKLISTYKHIAAIHLKNKNFAERNEMYRKVLELDENDREALAVLNENDRLRSLISDKIKSSAGDLSDITGMPSKPQNEDLDLEIDMVEAAPEEQHEDLKTLLKEAKTFMQYKLYNKAIEKITGSEGWESSEVAYDILIESYIFTGDEKRAGELILDLIELKLKRNKLDEVADLLSDANDILGSGDPRLAEITKRYNALTAPAVPEDVAEKEIAASAEQFNDLMSELAGQDFDDSFAGFDKNVVSAEVRQDFTDNEKEPPLTQLDELEFYISVDDYASATQLLQELLINYPESEFLKEFKTLIPVANEDDLSETVKNMKDKVDETFKGDESADDIYDLATSYVSMKMFAEAASLFEKALKTDPKNIKCLIGLANTQVSIGRFREAVDTLKKAEESTDDAEMIKVIKDRIGEIESKSN